MAPCRARARFMLPVRLQTPTLYRSAVLSVSCGSARLLKPAGTSTRPSASVAADVVWRGRFSGAMALHVFVAGSYTSAVFVRTLKSQVAGGGPVHVRPPATRTWPFAKRVATCSARRVPSDPAALQVPVAGL